MSEPTVSATRPKNSRKSHHSLVTAPPAAISAPVDVSLRERVAARLQGLAGEAQCADLAEGASDPAIAGDTVRQLMAHQLAAGHTLAMGLTVRAGRLVRECETEADGDGDGRRSMELLRFVAGTARLMERCRAAALALDRIGFPEPSDDPDGDGPQNCDHPHHYAWRLASERKRERRQVLDWLAQGKKAADLPDVEDWPPYHNPDPDIEKLDERIARTPRHAAPGLRRGRLRNGNPSGDYLKASRCGARTRCGGSCRQPAMPSPRGSGGRCRFHGGKSTGPRSDAGRERARTARLVHGFRSAEIIDLRSAAARTGRDLRALTSVAKKAFTTKSQSTRSEQVSYSHPLSDGNVLNFRAAVGRARIPLHCRKDAVVTPRHNRFVPFVTLWCNPSSSIPAGHGVDRSNRGPVFARSRRRLFG